MRKKKRKIEKTNKLLDIDEFKSLSHAKAKEIFKEIKYNLDFQNQRKQLEKIIQEIKLREYPEILEVHYYPIIKNIETIGKPQQIQLDTILMNSYHRYGLELKGINSDVLDFLIQNNIIEKEYIFHCTCGSDECYDKKISQEYFDKLKAYWIKEMTETTTEEDNEMNYGCFETGCWNDGDIEICSLEDFNKYLRRIEYVIIKEPDMTLDNI